MSLVYTTSYGSPVNYPHASQRASTTGPLLLQDFHHIDVLANLGRERIPERLVHAKGAGAYGYFEVTQDMSQYTSQILFRSVGTKVPATVRFSTVAGESGSADTSRDINGIAIKLKTEQGILDLACLNTPTFFIRDPAKYPDLVHVTKRNPETNLRDHDMFWDFFSQNPETIHQLMFLFSDRGTPDGFHRQNAFGGTTFVWSKEDGSFHYAKFHFKLPPGRKVQTLTDAEATALAGSDPDYNTRKLYNDIKAEKFPVWIASIQTMTPEQAMSDRWRHIVFDVTKTWPQAFFPLQEIGKLVLNESPKNYFNEIEQLGFSPAHLIPYIEPSPDPLFQARLFIYPDTQRYRLGVNNLQLPCNAPDKVLNCKEFDYPPLPTVANHQRAGAASYVSQGNRPNYQATTQSLAFDGPPNAIDSQIRNNHRHEVFHGSAYRAFDLPTDLTDRDFEQPRALWNLWTDDEKQAFVNNVAGHIGQVVSPTIQINQLYVFNAVDPILAQRIADAINLTFFVKDNPISAVVDNLKMIKKDLIHGGPE